MSKAQQTKLNLILSEKLADYIICNPDVLKKFSGCSYVLFSQNNSELNELNSELIKELISEGKKVVKAQETSDRYFPWGFSRIYN